MTTIQRTILLTIAALFLLSCRLSGSDQGSGGNWPQWRGPMHTGASPDGRAPVTFGESKNLKWKTAIPGKGHATPIVWGDKIILTTSVATEEKATAVAGGAPEGHSGPMGAVRSEYIHEYKVVVVSRNDGKILWEKTVAREMPQEGTHDLGSWASNSPATDGELIFAYFGSRGIHCLDFNGNILWQKDFGQQNKHMSFGEGESPYLYKDRLFIQWDHNGESFLVALDKKTGNELWRAGRDEITSWATPLVIEVNGKAQVVTSAPNQVRSYDAESGELVWTATGMTRNTIPNPVYDDGILYLASGFRSSALMAIDPPKAKGDITGSNAILWSYNQDTPYTPNLLLMEGKLYFVRVNNGFLTCLDAKTGAVIYSKQKLEGISTLFSSPTGADGKIYIASKGVVLVIKAGENFELLASNRLDDDFHASPVVVGNELLIRGFSSLYCFTE